MNPLILTSALFSTNAFSASCKKYYLYSLCFTCLTLTSLAVHGSWTRFSPTNVNALLLLDKAAIASVVVIGGYIFYEKCTAISRFSFIYEKITIIATFLFVILLYCYGWYIEDYCFCPDPHQADEYHMLMHLIGSLGHHLIALI
jgi:hypothetical protein